MAKPEDGIKSAITTKTTKEELLDEAQGQRTALRGRQAKYNNLSAEEEAALKSLDKVIESLEKNLAAERKAAEDAALRTRTK